MANPSERAPTARLLKRLAAAAGIDDAGRVLRDFASYLPTQVLPALTGLLVLPLLARKLEPTYLGVVALAQTLVTLGWTLIGGWLATSIIRELPMYARSGNVAAFRQILTRALGLVVVALVIFLGIVSLVGAFSAAVGDHEFLIVAATAGLLTQNVAVSLFAASLRPLGYVLVDVSARTGGYALGVWLVFQNHGVDGYLGGLAIASTTIGLIGLYFAWPREGVPLREPAASGLSGDGLETWLRYGLPAAASGFATWGLAFIDRYLLAAYRSTGAVGVYSLGNLIGDKPVAIPTMAFMTAAGPLLITAFERRGRGEVERLMRAYTRILVLVGLPAIAFLAAAAVPIVHVVAGDEYRNAHKVVAIIACGSFLYGLSLVGYTGLILAKRTMPMVYAAFLGLGVNVASNIVLIPRFGIVGAAIATPIGMAVFLGATQIWSRRYVHWHFPWSTLVRAAIAAILAFLAARTAVARLQEELAQITGALLVCTATYAFVVVSLGERRAAGSIRSETGEPRG